MNVLFIILQLQMWLSNIKPFVTDEWRLVIFCSHQQQGKFASFLRSKSVPACHAVRELVWRKTDGKGKEEPGPGGMKFTSNYESMLWCKFGYPLSDKEDGQEAPLGDNDFPFGRFALPQLVKDNLRLLCFSSQRIRPAERTMRRFISGGQEKVVVANEYQKGPWVSQHAVSLCVFTYGIVNISKRLLV